MLKKQGLYLPEFEHENCGAGFICNLKGEKTNQIIHDAFIDNDLAATKSLGSFVVAAIYKF